MFALVDDADYAELSKHKWCVSDGYAVRKIGKKVTAMHRVILNTPVGMHSDHINGDRLDNRRCNLRVCTRTENMRNRASNRNTSSQYRGVSLSKSGWAARIRLSGHLQHIGFFANEADAARAYDARAVAAWGEFARLNFPAERVGDLAASLDTA